MGARDVDVDVLLRDKSGPGAASFERRLKGMDDAAKRAQKQIDSMDFGAAGLRAADQFGKALVSKVGALAGPAGAVLVGAVAASLPLLGALMSGTVVGGAGLGGLVGGAILAARDPRVAKAGQDMASRILYRLDQAARPWIGPVLDAVDHLEAKILATVDGPIANILRNSARWFEPTLAAMVRGVHQFAVGLDAAVAKAGPVLKVIGQGVEVVLAAAGQGLRMFSEGAMGGALALEFTFRAIAASILVVAKTASWLAQIFQALALSGALGPEFQKRAVIMAATMGQATTAVQGTAAAFRTAADAAKQYQQSVDQVLNTNRGLAGTEIAVHAALDAVSEARRENGKTLDLTTEKGRANAQSLVNLSNELSAYRTGLQETGASTAEVAEATVRGRNQFIAAAMQMGKNAQEAQNLADRYLGIPTKVGTVITAEEAQALAATRAIINGLNSIDRNVMINITTRRTFIGPAAPNGGYTTGFGPGAAPAADTRSGRAQQAQTIQVDNQTRVFLDGQPFRDMTVRTYDQLAGRDRWISRTGQR